MAVRMNINTQVGAQASDFPASSTLGPGSRRILYSTPWFLTVGQRPEVAAFKDADVDVNKVKRRGRGGDVDSDLR